MHDAEPPNGRRIREASIGRLLVAAAILGVLAVLGGIGLWMFLTPVLR